MKTIKTSEIDLTIAEIMNPTWINESHGPSETSRAYHWLEPVKGKEYVTQWGWQPLDFTHDPRGTIMLLEWLKINGCIHWHFNALVYEPDWKEGMPEGLPKMFTCAGDDMGVVARAFLQAHGIIIEDK